MNIFHLGKIAHYGRHLKIVWRHMTNRKLYNLLKIAVNYVNSKQIINTMPAFLKIEASRKCLVNCKYCSGEKEEKFFPKHIYQAIMDKLYPWVIEVSLYDIGEPLWCEDLIEFIKYAKQRNVGTSISTSLSLPKNKRYWEILVQSGLDHLIVAIDGISEKTYKEYRTNGNLQLVMQNLYAIINAKTQHNSKLTIEWQMIEFEWNRHEIAEAKKTASNLGLEFRLIKEVTKPRKEAQNNVSYVRNRNCLLPYLIFIVNAFGEVNPCYKYYNPYMKIGNIKENCFEEIWNNEEIRKIRDRELIKTRPICCKCNE